MKFYNNMQFPLGLPGAPGQKGERGLSGKFMFIMLQIFGLCTFFYFI